MQTQLRTRTQRKAQGLARRGAVAGTGQRTAQPDSRRAAQRDGPSARRQLPGPSQAARTPFVLLVVTLLGGALVCLLVINTTLATAAFQINRLQHQDVRLSQQEQVLQQRVAIEQSPARIEQEALALGLRPQQHLRFLDARTGRIYRTPGTVPGVSYAPPGYVP